LSGRTIRKSDATPLGGIDDHREKPEPFDLNQSGRPIGHFEHAFDHLTGATAGLV
jgi:hypothetical protein